MTRPVSRRSLALRTSVRSQSIPFHMRFVVDKVALEEIFLLSTSVSPCQYRSTIAQDSSDIVSCYQLTLSSIKKKLNKDESVAVSGAVARCKDSQQVV